MSTHDSHAPGTFCWVELATSDGDAAKKFYLPLCGWNHRDDPMGPDAVYTMLMVGDRHLGALYTLNEQMRQQGIPPHWGSYVSVADLDASAAKVTSLGGKLLLAPMDVMEFGRMATLQDPTGAVLNLWQPKQHIGAQVLNEPVSLCWNELMTTDTDAAEAFYRGLFDWGAKTSNVPGMKYTEFTQGDRSVAGMMAIGPEMGPVPPNWMLYFAVAAVDDFAKTAGETGAKLIVPPQDIPKVGRFSVIQDPQGAVFGAITLTGA